jgi:hypothetical protein
MLRRIRSRQRERRRAERRQLSDVHLWIERCISIGVAACESEAETADSAASIEWGGATHLEWFAFV